MFKFTFAVFFVAEYLYAGDNGDFTSLNYPNDYVSHLDQRWIVWADEGHAIELVIPFYQIENNFDFLLVSACQMCQMCNTL